MDDNRESLNYCDNRKKNRFMHSIKFHAFKSLPQVMNE